MAPIRRYLRISKYSVLECRIYLENPSDNRWLLDPRDPKLPKIFQAIKPLVLPKLREENERALAKKKSNPVKDVITEDDFEVAIFLRESGTRHSLLARHKTFGGTGRIKSNSTKLTGEDSSGAAEVSPHVLVESDEETAGIPTSIPESLTVDDQDDSSRKRRQPHGDASERLPNKRNKTDDGISEEDNAQDDKKLPFTTQYEGFSIWGWVLCLLVTRKDRRKRQESVPSVATSQALMEEWISTQVQPDLEEE